MSQSPLFILRQQRPLSDYPYSTQFPSAAAKQHNRLLVAGLFRPYQPLNMIHDVTLDAPHKCCACIFGWAWEYWNMTWLCLVFFIPLLHLDLGCLGIFGWWNTWFLFFLVVAGLVFLVFIRYPQVMAVDSPRNVCMHRWQQEGQHFPIGFSFICRLLLCFKWLPSSVYSTSDFGRFVKRGQGLDGCILSIEGDYLSFPYHVVVQSSLVLLLFC